jgi:hypothetical protein
VDWAGAVSSMYSSPKFYVSSMCGVAKKPRVLALTRASVIAIGAQAGSQAGSQAASSAFAVSAIVSIRDAQ